MPGVVRVVLLQELQIRRRRRRADPRTRPRLPVCHFVRRGDAVPPAADGFVAPLGFVLRRVHVGGGDAAQHDVSRVLQPGARGRQRGILRVPHVLASPAGGTGGEGVRFVPRAAAFRSRADGVFVIPERVDRRAVVFGRDVLHARAPPRALHGLALDAHRGKLPLGLGFVHAAAHFGRELQDAETRHVLAVPRDVRQSLLLVLRQMIIIRGDGRRAHRHGARLRGRGRSRRARSFVARSELRRAARCAADRRRPFRRRPLEARVFVAKLAPDDRRQKIVRRIVDRRERR